MQSLQHHYKPSRDHRAVRVINRYVSNLPPMPGVFPDYPEVMMVRRRMPLLDQQAT